MTAGNQFRCQLSPSAHTGLGSARLHSDDDDDDDDDDDNDDDEDDGSEEKRVVRTMRYVVTTFNVCTLINKKNSDDFRDVVHTHTVSKKNAISECCWSHSALAQSQVAGSPFVCKLIFW